MMMRTVELLRGALVGICLGAAVGCVDDVEVRLPPQSSTARPHNALKPLVREAVYLETGDQGSVLRVAAEESTSPGGATATAADAGAETAEPYKPKLDPIVANGPIFEGWPKPLLAIVFTGDVDGYIEPCGCAGLDNQKGGLKRRHTLLKQLEADGWPLVKVDVGGLTKRLGPQTEIKYRYIFDALREMGYSAIQPGMNELLLGADAVAYPLIQIGDAEENPMVSANVGVYAMDSGLTRPYRIVTAGGKRVGVTGVLGAKYVEQLKTSGDIIVDDPTTALAKVAPQLAGERCDLQILLVHGDPAEADDLARKFPQFQIVVAAGGAHEPPSAPAKIAGSTAARIEPGSKGEYAVVLGIFDDPKQTYRYQRVPLDARFADAPEMQRVLVAYQQELETMTLAGLGLKGVENPEGEFAGSAVCGDCHTKAWEVFEKTPHYHATDTLEKLDPPRQYDPECLSCHVTGWNPQEYFPYVSGFISRERTPELVQNGCENCHGPGAAHVAAETGEVDATDAEVEALRAALRMKIVANEGNKEGQEFATGSVVKNCMKCHDQDNSPDFDFQKYWPKVKHVGKLDQ